MRKKSIIIRGQSLLELLARTPSPLARAAQRTGSASGAHGKDPARLARRKARQSERRAMRGEYDS